MDGALGLLSCYGVSGAIRELPWDGMEMQMEMEALPWEQRRAQRQLDNSTVETRLHRRSQTHFCRPVLARRSKNNYVQVQMIDRQFVDCDSFS